LTTVGLGIAVVLAAVAAMLGREAALVAFAAAPLLTGDGIGAYPPSSGHWKLSERSEREEPNNNECK
jgi:hypothetical protein